MLYLRGVSPRPASAEYYRPAFRDPAMPGLPALDPQAQSANARPSESDEESSSSEGEAPGLAPATPSSGSEDGGEREPAPSPASAPSPSMARSPLPNDAPPCGNERARGSSPSKELALLGLAPFRAVVFAKTGDELVFAMTPHGDRVAVYYPRERAVALRKQSRMLPGVPLEAVTETVITSVEDAERQGADALGFAAGAAAGGMQTSAAEVVFGALAAATNPENPRSSRYFSLLSQSSEHDPRGGETDVFIYALTRDAAQEFSRGEKHARFAHARAVVPIVHSSSVEGEAKGALAAGTVCAAVRRATERGEGAFVMEATQAAEKSFARRYERVRVAAARMRDAAAACVAARARETAQLVPRAQAGEAGAHSRLADLAVYAAHVEEIIGQFVSRVEAALAEAEGAAERAVCELYAETRMVLAPEPRARGLGFARAERWGFCESLDHASLATVESARRLVAAGEAPLPLANALRRLIVKRERCEAP